MDHLNAMDDVLTRLRDALASPGRLGDGPATGTSTDGLVTATLDPDGRVRHLEADPRVLRSSAAAIGAAVVEAVNEARESLLAEASGGPGLLEQLAEVRDDSVRLMARTTEEQVAAVKRMQDLHR